jgi:O-methyltransferase
MTRSFPSKLTSRFKKIFGLKELDLHQIFTEENSTFFGDNSATKQHVEFLLDKRFIESREFTYRDAPENVANWVRQTNIDWRIHIVTWAASKCMQIDGDFVECGVWWGWLSRAICYYTDFQNAAKRFHFYDSWGEEGSHENYQVDIFDKVKYRFKNYPNVLFHRGMVPDVLWQSSLPDKIAYLSLDMNGGLAERQALDILYPKVASGGVIYVDDYGWNYPRLRSELADFLKDKPEELLHFPCGSSIIIKA